MDLQTYNQKNTNQYKIYWRRTMFALSSGIKMFTWWRSKPKNLSMDWGLGYDRVEK